MSDRSCSVDECGRPYSSKGYCAMHAERVRRNGHPDLTVSRPRKSLADRLWAKVDRSGGPDACWPWTGVITKEGYGRIRSGVAGEPTIGAHRAAYLVSNPGAPVPELLDHRCHDPKVCEGGSTCLHRRCCNPAHTSPSTVQENSSVDRQRTRRLTACCRNHEFTPENTYVWRGQRRCRACDTERARARRAA